MVGVAVIDTVVIVVIVTVGPVVTANHSNYVP